MGFNANTFNFDSYSFVHGRNITFFFVKKTIKIK